MIKKIENAEKYFEGSLLNGDDLLRVVVLKLNEVIDKLNEEELIKEVK